MLKNTQQQYGSLAIFFHWLIALLVVVMLILGAFMDKFSGLTKTTLIHFHKSLGLTLLGLMLLRLFWRLINITPDLPRQIHTWQRIAARVSHFLLYTTLIIMPLSGWVMATAAGKAPNFWGLGVIHAPFVTVSADTSHVANTIHFYTAWIITFLLCLHVLGAMKHYFYDKDYVFERMLGKKLKDAQ